MNYLIWKGEDSRDIKGLVICELPPIAKPQMRVAETVIDGVDGSIIEELGYSSYDKALTIGLTQNADIDEILQYFTGSGEIVFSNEADKVYKAHIINQIDYARLVRFRTATVVFRVQPFKYEYLEKIESVSGVENLFDIGTETSTRNGITTNFNQREILMSGTTTGENYLFMNYGDAKNNRRALGVFPKGQYTFKAELVNGEIDKANGSYQFILSKLSAETETTIKTTTNAVNDEITFELSEDCELLYYAYANTQGQVFDNVKIRYLLIKGNVAVDKMLVDNVGNYKAKPIIEIKGTGEIRLAVNGNTLFRYTFPENEDTVVIDSQKQDAYLGANLKNRNMSGEFPTFEIGENIITWEGAISSIQISSKSRWL